ncbi:hypothetical protein Prudu_019451 [Prunus dulcis]|uniref:Uncharacterized protein n=1 Tax=Prunus dulcis TaxID=3755 RepID=A0A4Y1RT05_PRUDU|nr:hypothetical protein Prudu_019451 [Prunus dulcis]
MKLTHVNIGYITYCKEIFEIMEKKIENKHLSLFASITNSHFSPLIKGEGVALNGQNVPQAYAQKRCDEQLYASGCTLSDCGKKCWEKHHDPGYKCIANVAQTDYACYCMFNC